MHSSMFLPIRVFEQRLQENLTACDYSACGNKKLKPEFSRISGGGSMSKISNRSIDLDISSTENGMLQCEIN